MTYKAVTPKLSKCKYASVITLVCSKSFNVLYKQITVELFRKYGRFHVMIEHFRIAMTIRHQISTLNFNFPYTLKFILKFSSEN